MVTTTGLYLGNLHPMRELGVNPNLPHTYRSQGDGKTVLDGNRTTTTQHRTYRRWYRDRICSRKSSIPALHSNILSFTCLPQCSPHHSHQLRNEMIRWDHLAPVGRCEGSCGQAYKQVCRWWGCWTGQNGDLDRWLESKRGLKTRGGVQFSGGLSWVEIVRESWSVAYCWRVAATNTHRDKSEFEGKKWNGSAKRWNSVRSVLEVQRE